MYTTEEVEPSDCIDVQWTVNGGGAVTNCQATGGKGRDPTRTFATRVTDAQLAELKAMLSAWPSGGNKLVREHQFAALEDYRHITFTLEGRAVCRTFTAGRDVPTAAFAAWCDAVGLPWY